MNSYPFVVFILVIGAILVAYNTLVYRSKIEEYGNFHTEGSGVVSVKSKERLVSLGCIRSPVDDIVLKLREKFYITRSNFYSISVEDIYGNILADLNSTVSINRGMVIEGPVYVIIYQQHEKEKDPGIGTDALLTTVCVLYPSYDKDMMLLPDKSGMEAFNSFFKASKTEKRFCSLHCNVVRDKCACVGDAEELTKEDCVNFNKTKWNYGMVYGIDKDEYLFASNFTHLQ